MADTRQQIIFDYTDGPSAPISADWAIDLGLFDCETHEIDADRYPLGCADQPPADVQATASPLFSGSSATESSASPLLNTDGPSGMGSPLALLVAVVLVGLGVLGYQLFSNRRKGAPDADPAS